MSRMTDRREFLKEGLALASALVAAGTVDVIAPMVSQAAQSPDLAVARGSDPGKLARAAVDALGGMSKFVSPGNRVVVKPNMSFARTPDQAANTHPEVVREVCRMCVEAGASRVSVLDYVLHEPKDCLSMSKIPELCGSIDKTVVSAIQGKRRFREVKVPQGQSVKSMEVSVDVLDADVLIAVPVGKSHGASGVSLSMKGMMGLIYDRHSFHGRHDLHTAIADMVTVLKPKLVVVDGTRIMSDGGPGGPGRVIRMNLVIASTDMVAADAQMVALGEWYGRPFRPDQVRHIKIAGERGLGQMDLKRVNIKEVQV